MFATYVMTFTFVLMCVNKLPAKLLYTMIYVLFFVSILSNLLHTMIFALFYGISNVRPTSYI